MNRKLTNLMNRTGITSNPWPHISAFLGNWSSNSRTFHFTLVVDNDTSVVLEVNGGSVLSMKRLGLSNNDAWHDLFPQLRFTFLDSGHNHISNDGDDVKVFGSGVVSAVHNGGNWKSEGNMEFASQRTSSSSFRHG